MIVALLLFEDFVFGFVPEKRLSHFLGDEHKELAVGQDLTVDRLSERDDARDVAVSALLRHHLTWKILIVSHPHRRAD